METPPPDPRKLLAYWMDWEKGTETPGRVMSNLKTAGMRELLEALGASETGAVRTQSQPPAPPSA